MKSKRNRLTGEEAKELIPDGINPELQAAMESWADYKDERGEPLTPTGWKMWFSRMKKYPPRLAVEAIEHAISMDWQGVHFEPVESRPAPQVRSSKANSAIY